MQWPAGPDGERVRPAGALRAVLGLSAGEVSLAAGDYPVTQRPGGCGGRRLRPPGNWRGAGRIPGPEPNRVRMMRRWWRWGGG